MERIASRYQVVGRLGEGASGEVLLCEDLTSGGRVALKRLEAGSAEATALLRRELEHLRRARHPHLVDVREFGFDLERRRAFYTARVVSGETLGRFARGRPWAELLVPLGHALDALAHLHALGLIHGDFKPDNIMVSASGDGTLLDLSASVRIGSGERPAMATPGYAAPDAVLDARSDLYAVGATLRELAREASAVPSSLPSLIRRLTQPDPASRPANVDELLTLLGVEVSQRAAVVPYAFVGRETELGMAAAGRTLHVVGAPGSGKSTLLAEIVARAETAMPVVTLDGTRPDPFAPLLRHLDWTGPADALAVMDALSELENRGERLLIVVDDVQRFPPASRRILAAMVEVAGRSANVAVVSAGTEPFAHPEVVLPPLPDAALARWLGPLLAPEALAVVLDRSRGLPGVARRLALAAMDGALGPEALAQLADRLGDGPVLDALSPGELEALAAAASGVLSERAAAVLALSPATLARLEQLDILRARGPDWVATRPIASDTLRARLGEPRWRAVHVRLAQALAVTRATNADEAHALGAALLHALFGGEEVSDRLETARDAVERWPHAFALLPGCSDARLEPPARAIELARIQIAAGEPERALARLTHALRRRPAHDHRADLRELAGQAYAALGDTRRAAGALTRAQSRRPSAALAHALSLVHAKQGKNHEARAVAESALPIAQGSVAIDLWCDVAQASSFLGDAPAAEEALARAAALDTNSGRTSTRRAAVRGLVALRRGDSAAAELAYAEMLKLALEHRLDDLVAFAGLNYGAVCHQRGAFAAALDAYTRGLRAARVRGLTSAEARAAYNLGTLHFELGQTELAEAELNRALTQAERERLPFVAGASLLVLGEAAARAGAWGRARDAFERARAALSACDARRELCELDVEQALLELAGGDAAAAEARVTAAAAGAEALAADDLRARVGGARGQLELRRGRPSQALTELERALALAEQIPHPLLAAKLAGAVAEVCAAAGAPALGERHRARARELWERITVGLPDAVRELRAPARPEPAVEPDLDWRRVLGIYRRLSQATTPRDVLRETLDAAIDLTRAERGFLIIVDERKGERVLRAPVARNLDREALEKPQLKFSRSIAESVIDSAEPLVTVDAERDPRFSDKRSVHAMQLRSVLCVPIVAASGVLGSIYLDNRFRTAGFGTRETELVVMCADQAALALEKARLLEDLEEKARALEAEHARVEELMRAQAAEIRDLSRALDQRRESAVLEGVVGSSPAMRAVFALVERVAPTDITVLVTGESGTGKELIARAIHDKSPRAKAGLSAINCGAVPEALLEAELFGYKKGAFTGANQDRDGLFVAARGGTVFLDEIGEMPPAMQVKLLRVLQEREVKPLGSERSVPTDVRVVCATHRALKREVEAGRFREDLYYRLAVVEIGLPPLRERRDDLPALTSTLLTRIAGELGRPSPRVSSDALLALAQHAWPGNVRELHNVLARAAVLCTGEVITRGDLGLGPIRAGGGKRPAPDARGLEQALIDSGMNASEAARRLGVGRATLYRWLARAGIDRSRLAPDAAG